MMTYREFLTQMMMCGDTLATVEGVPPLSMPKSKGKALKDYRVYGQSVQDGTPTPSNPIEVESVGDLVTSGEHQGKYKIPLAVSDSLAYEPNLPSEYQQVEYLHADTNNRTTLAGTAFIKTGIYASNNLSFELRYRENSGVTSQYCFGTYPAPRTLINLRSGQENLIGYFTYGGAGKNLYGTSIDWEQVHTYKVENNTLYVDGVSKYKYPLSEPWVNTTEIGLFTALNADGTPHRNSGNIYYCKLWESGVLVRHFIPCRRKSDSVLGMYDLVSGTFFTNAGTGAFTAGPDINGTTTDIYLDAPLRKIGNYADYIDFKGQKVVRNIAERIFNGSENWVKYGAENLNTFYLGGPLTQYYVYGEVTVCSSHFVGGPNTSRSVVHHANETWVVSYSSTNCFHCIEALDYTLLADFKAFLAAQYAAGTPVRVDYILATPAEESISLPSIPTIKGQCYFQVLTNTQPSNAQTKYIK